MEKQASQMMGEPVSAGVKLESQDVMKEAVGGVIGGLLSGKSVKSAALPGNHNGPLYLGVGVSKIGFFSLKVGMIKVSLKEKLAEFPREDVKAFDVGKGYMPSVEVLLQDDTLYAFKCAKVNVKNAKKVEELLNTPS